MQVDDLQAPTLNAEDAHHLQRVLRVREGEKISLIDGRGNWRIAVWRNSSFDVSSPDATEQFFEPSVGNPVSVALPFLKGDHTDLAVQKLTELGVNEIVLLSVANAAVRLSGDKQQKVMSRLERIAQSAAMQSRQVYLPQVRGPISVAQCVDEGFALCGWGQRAEPFSISQQVAQPGPSALAVGPEGGWSPEEVQLVENFVLLAGGVLRSETAAITAGVLLTTARHAS